MSWSEHLRNVTVQELVEFTPSEHTQKFEDQFEVAAQAAIDLIAEGVVGDPEKHKFTVSLSGHGNKDHEPAAGWANDCVSLSVTQD